MNTVINSLLSVSIASVIGATVMLNGVVLKTDDLTATAHLAANRISRQQLATALELYYLDHNQYPKIAGGPELIEVLADGAYIEGRPLNSSVFDYQALNGGQWYKLEIANN